MMTMMMMLMVMMMIWVYSRETRIRALWSCSPLAAADKYDSVLQPVKRQQPEPFTVRCRQQQLSKRLCIELWDSVDACGVSSCGIWAGRRPPLGSSRAECIIIIITWFI